MFDDGTPIYLQIAGQVRDDVVAGFLRPGEQVMSTNQYAAFHRINPATAGKALQQLVEEGVLEKRRGIGMFVAPGAAEHLRAQRRSHFVDRHVAPLLAEAGRLGLTVDDVLAAVRDTAGLHGVLRMTAAVVGARLTGPADAVDALTAGRRVVHERALGRTKSAVVLGPLDEEAAVRATRAGVDLSPLPLQDLFVHLTTKETHR